MRTGRDYQLEKFVFGVYKILDISGLYYNHVTIVNYASSSVNKLKASLNDDARVVIYNRHIFIVQATGRNFPYYLFS